MPAFVESARSIESYCVTRPDPHGEEPRSCAASRTLGDAKHRSGGPDTASRPHPSRCEDAAPQDEGIEPVVTRYPSHSAPNVRDDAYAPHPDRNVRTMLHGISLFARAVFCSSFACRRRAGGDATVTQGR